MMQKFKFWVLLAVTVAFVVLPGFKLRAFEGAANEQIVNEEALSPEDKAIIDDLELLENMDVLEQDMALLQELNAYEEEYVEYLGEETHE